MDPNGRRVLAAYQLMILNRPDLAAVTLYQAEEAFYHLPKVYTEAEVELDKKFIAELKNRLNIMSNPVQENSPVMSYRPDSYR